MSVDSSSNSSSKSAKHYSRRFIHWRLFLHAHTVFVAFRLMAFSWCMYHYGHNEQVIWTRYLQYDPSMAIVLGMRSIINFDSLTGLVFVLIIIVHFSFDYVLYFHNRVKKCDQRLWVIFFSLITKNGSLSFSQRGKKSFEDWLHNDCLNLRALPGELRHLWKCSKIKLVAQFPVWPHLFPPIRTALLWLNSSTYMHVLFLLTFNLVPVSVYFISLLYMRNLSSLERFTYSFAIYLIAFINLCTLQPLRKRMLRDRLSLLNYYTKLSCHEALKFRLDPVGIVTQRNLVEFLFLYSIYLMYMYNLFKRYKRI
ncbi:hypothetical protein TYRP_012123 [Tyrophagus putrescentiae]|nr:hypothetical protein TYRP_012123 [Tyrophagus putrescentiae]